MQPSTRVLDNTSSESVPTNAPTITIRLGNFLDSADRRNHPALYGSLQSGPPGVQYPVEFFIAGGMSPAPLIVSEWLALVQRLQAIREQVIQESRIEERQAALEERRGQLEDQLDQATASAAQARERAAGLVARGKNLEAKKEHQAAILADEEAKSYQTALGEVPGPDRILAGVWDRLQMRLQGESERIQKEALSRYAKACEWLTVAVSGGVLPAEARDKDLLQELALATALARRVATASPAERSVFGSAVGELENLVASLGQVAGYQRPRRVGENNQAPVPRGF